MIMDHADQLPQRARICFDCPLRDGFGGTVDRFIKMQTAAIHPCHIEPNVRCASALGATPDGARELMWQMIETNALFK